MGEVGVGSAVDREPTAGGDPGSPDRVTGPVTVGDLLDDDEIRGILAKPRQVPRDVRREIAGILAHELLTGTAYEIRDTGKFIERLGAFHPLLISLRSSDEWTGLKEVSRKYGAVPVSILKFALPRILDLLEDFAKFEPDLGKALSTDLAPLLERFKTLLEDTMALWGRTVPPVPAPAEAWAPALRTAVEQFQGLTQAPAFMRTLTGTLLLPGLGTLWRKLESISNLLDTLALLFPGRGWDYAIIELHRALLSDLDRYSKLLDRNEDIRKMLELMGRIELEYGSRRIAISPFGTSEVHSVAKSKEIERVLPVELVKLHAEPLRTLFFARWLEGNLLTYELRGRHWVDGPPKKKRQGPVVALVDTSGSMNGSPEVVAKALVLAVVRRMLREHRDVKVILFSSVDETREFELTRTKAMGRRFLEFLNLTFGGGTDFNTALRQGLASLEKGNFKNADLLFITDGLSDVSDKALLDRWTAFKETTDTRIFTVIVGNETAGGLERLSDHTLILAEGDRWSVDASPADVVRLIAAPHA